MVPLTPAALDGIPRLGWVHEPTPVTSLSRLASARGLAYLGVKRDDLLGSLHGGTKPRKLEYLLAAPPFAEASAWASSGGIGSGSLVALTEAARVRGRRLVAHMFPTPVSAGIAGNLAFTASGPTTIVHHSSRAALALCRPSVVLGGRSSGVVVVPPGATSPRGMVGLVRAALELCVQIREGELPEPEHLYVALGSGGTAIGLATGLALGGVGTKVIAVAVVEHLLSLGPWLRRLARALFGELAGLGISAPSGPLPLVIDRAHLGAGYAHPTAESLAACDALAAEGIPLEPVYTGKAMAALLAGAGRTGPRSALFWCTVHGPLPAPAPAFRNKLPAPLRRLVD